MNHRLIRTADRSTASRWWWWWFLRGFRGAISCPVTLLVTIKARAFLHFLLLRKLQSCYRCLWWWSSSCDGLRKRYIGRRLGYPSQCWEKESDCCLLEMNKQWLRRRWIIHESTVNFSIPRGKTCLVRFRSIWLLLSPGHPHVTLSIWSFQNPTKL